MKSSEIGTFVLLILCLIYFPGSVSLAATTVFQRQLSPSCINVTESFVFAILGEFYKIL